MTSTLSTLHQNNCSREQLPTNDKKYFSKLLFLDTSFATFLQCKIFSVFISIKKEKHFFISLFFSSSDSAKVRGKHFCTQTPSLAIFFDWNVCAFERLEHKLLSISRIKLWNGNKTNIKVTIMQIFNLSTSLFLSFFNLFLLLSLSPFLSI